MRRSLLAPIIALLLCGGSIAAYLVLRSTVGGMSLAVATINHEIERKAAESARLSSVRERLAALADVERRVHAYFVPDTAVVAFIGELEARGAALGGTVEIDSVEAHPDEKTFEVALSITGTFDAVVRTVGSIEYAPYDLRTTSFSLVLDEGKHVWRASLTLVAGSREGGGAAFVTPAEEAPVVASATTTATSTKPFTTRP